MGRFIPQYKPVEIGVSIVAKEAHDDYRNTSKVRDPKKFGYYTDYRRITRKIWKKVAEDSVSYEGGVYAKGFFYLVPQVITNTPFIELANGKIKTNPHTEGDVYSPIFCNLFDRLDHFCWSIEGTYVASYKNKLKTIIDKYAPKYFFMLPLLLKNKL